MAAVRLQNTVMGYDWGSRTVIAELFGRPSPSDAPEAELWIGAHASAPSMILGDHSESGLTQSIAQWIARSPGAALGATVRDRFGDRLPFLLKVLAAEVPLSLQAHPSLEQAKAGHAREEAAGIPLLARHRSYRDTNHKPEILCALGPFEALCGFRPVTESRGLLERLGVALLKPVAEALAKGDGVKPALEWLMRLEGPHAATLVCDAASACEREAAKGGDGAAHLAWIVALSKLHPGDVGVVASLLLNHVRLDAGDAVFLPAGNLHSYLRGAGVELMASSDNVLRGGLTSKHVDVDELLSVLDFSAEPFRPVPTRGVCDHETEYRTAAADFRLSRVVLREGDVCRPMRRGPELLLCVEGALQLAGEAGAALSLKRGDSVFVPGSDGAYALTGGATLYRATVGDAAR